MILSLALRFQKQIALFLLSISFVQVTIAERIGRRYDPPISGVHLPLYSRYSSGVERSNAFAPLKQSAAGFDKPVIKESRQRPAHTFIGGPTQPESQSFQSVNSNNMVDLFSGDFSYNIPLLDVGGYPVNIAYHSGVTMDEEASWVGLGWNINPGSITRNMRGVPDDFNGGTDTIKKVSSIKPNVNWGVTGGANLELLGLPKILDVPAMDSNGFTANVTVGASLGIFHTTYNGWGFETGLNASVNAGSKSAGGLTGGLSLTNNSQNGITINPSLGYKFSIQKAIENAGPAFGGVQISAPYNSRTGLKGIQLGLNANAKNKSESKSGSADDFIGQTFAWPTYTPTITMPMTNYNFSVTLKFGATINGVHPNFYISGYGGKDYIAPADTSLSIPVYGYLNYQNMASNRGALTDFNREKEMPYREKPAIPHVAVPSYTYDVFSVSGEGTGGSFRAYRGDIGFIADHRMQSKTITGAASIDIGGGNLVHGGTDLNANYALNKNGPWESENPLGRTINFRNNQGLYEAVYFRNPGEKAINTTAYYDAIGGDDVVAPALSQPGKSSPTILATNTLNRYSGKKKVGSIDLNAANAVHTTRDKRSQVITYLTASEASVVGLEKSIYHYNINQFGTRQCEDNSVNDAIHDGTGLQASYFYNMRLSGTPKTRVDTTVFFDWGKDSPFKTEDRTYPGDYFAIRWLGRLKAPVTGTYTLGFRHDDGIRFWMNDTLLVDLWRLGSGHGGYDTIRVNLVKDQFYKIRLEYYDNAGSAFCKFLWRRPDQPMKAFDYNNWVAGKYLYPPKFSDTTIVDSMMVREDRINNFRKSTHISEVDVLNADGRRYVYGIPVYNILQKEVSFSVDQGRENLQTGLTAYSDRENSTHNNSGKEGYYSREEIPAYAHSFLLTGILSPDYVDVTGNGISDDDLGDAVKFSYSKGAGIASPFEWRAPYITDSVNYNAGLKSYNRDDKAHYIYGKKEMWYLHAIESKTMIANFTLASREDMLEIDERGHKKNNGKAFCLKQIDLYSKADFMAHGVDATPIKTVHFEYSYELCRGINHPVNDSGKLTLKRIWFTYNGNEKGKLNPYEFYYHSNNPGYRTNATDKWGTYKDPAQNPEATSTNPVNNADYPYSLQDSALAAYNAAAWTMDSIKLPSGGRIKVKYESDDYAYVQNRRATQMMELAGLGTSPTGTYGDRVYSAVDLSASTTDNLVAFIKVPVAAGSKQELYARYLEGMSKFYFRLLVHMPPNDNFGTGSEYVPCYAEPDLSTPNWYGFTNDPHIIWIRLAGVNKSGNGSGYYSPLALAALNFLRMNLPSKAYPGSELDDDNMTFLDGVRLIASNITNYVFLLNGFNRTARALSWAAHFSTTASYVRLNCPTLKKYGGGLRVKSVLIYDHWNEMTKKRESVYGQNYDYTTIQNVNGVPQKVSSGVASWEPAIGAEENPFHLPIEYTDRISALAPSSQQYSEEPLGEAFYPGASVGYSKVRVRSIHADKTRSANGYSETTFYTSYDFPTTWDWSMLDNDTKKRYKPVLRNFLRINAMSYLSLSQGFKVELNDMNGKIHTEATYSETDSVHPISYTENFYRVDNQSVQYKHLNNLVTSIDPYGNIDTAATIGKDVELMADMREQTSTSIGGNINLNADLFTVGVWPIVIPSLLNLFQKETNQFRSAAMTKVIYRYGIIDSVVHIEKGSKVSSKNMMYDAETGDPLLVRTQNEFNDPVYQFTYPAHWMYKGIGPAYQNIGALLTHVKITNGILSRLDQPDSVYLTAGDELLVYSKQTINATSCSSNDSASFADSYKLWVIDSNEVHGGAQQLFVVDQNGTPFSGNDVTLKVIRSGHRNVSGTVGSVASLRSPLVKDAQGKYQLVFDTATHVISADASEMAQYWKVADKRKSNIQHNCIPARSDSAEFAAEACSCMKPFFDYVIQQGLLFLKPGFSLRRRMTVGRIAAMAGINVSSCPILQANANQLFYGVNDSPTDAEYLAQVGSAQFKLRRLSASTQSFYNYTSSSCTPDGVIYRNPSMVIPTPDTVTVRITPDFSANLFSSKQCPSFKDSLTLVDSSSDHLMVETGLNMGGYERNAISILQFRNLDQIPDYASILSAQMILQADMRGHYPPLWPNANSVNPVDSISISLATPGWFPLVSLDTFHSETINSDWYSQKAKLAPFQSDTIDVLNYLNGYRNNTYSSKSFILTQGSQDFHGAAVTSSAALPGYLQSGYSNYYSTYYSQRYADTSKWPAIQVTYVVPPSYSDTGSLVLEYVSTLSCSDVIGRLCYSAITDTTVNPYQYGILGNFRPLRSYVYYGRRMESDPLQPVNTRTNGTIKDFAPFWTLQNSQWAPSYDTTRWVWNSQTTLFNRKGFELENKDPLGRYNAGLYGYGLTLPVAVVQNSHYQEAAYEGFEDYGFIANTCDTACAESRPFDFSAYQANFTTTQAHTGLYSLQVGTNSTISVSANIQPAADADIAQLTGSVGTDNCGPKLKGMLASKNSILPGFAPLAGQKVVVGGWVRENNSCLCKSYTRNHIVVGFVSGGSTTNIVLNPSGNLVEGWQRYEAVVDVPANATQMIVTMQASDSAITYFDDICIHPYNAEMKSYVYSSVNLRLLAELDENNYATFYEYDDDGTLVRLKKETERGVQTIKETRSALLKE